MKMIRFMSVSVENYKHIFSASSLFDIVMTLFTTKEANIFGHESVYEILRLSFNYIFHSIIAR